MRPPRRVCVSCGAHHFCWSEREPCRACLVDREVLENRSELAALTREQRLQRRRTVVFVNRDGSTTGSALELSGPVPYNEFPPGF